MADESGASPSIADPLPAASGFNATGFLRKYWWEIGLVVAVIAFLVYTYMKNNSAQVGTTAASPTIDPATGLPVVTDTTGTSTDMFNQLQTEIQSLLNQQAAEPGPVTGPPGPPGKQGPPGPAPRPSPKPKPSAKDVAWHKWALAHPAAAAAQERKAKAKAGHGGALAHGGPPPSGPTVPFGTHIGLHAPLISSGDMYATSR